MNNFNRYASVSDMITTLGWPTLEQRHKTLRTIMMYKIVNNLVDVATDNILIPSKLQLRGHAIRNTYNDSVGLTHTCIPSSHK